MATSLATFERLKDRGLAAYKREDYAAARSYLLEAAECMIERAASAKGPSVRRQHEEYARELIELAKECNRLTGAGKTARTGVTEREATATSASDWIIREKPDVGFDDIAGLDDVKEEIRLKMIYPFAHPELAQRYGISRGGGVLLYGPPGTGKTMIAKATAAELDATFFVVSSAEILSKWVGEAEQNVRRLFEAAKQEPRSIIFMDEVEALVPRRKSDGSAVMQRVVPQILQELEGFDQKTDRALLFMGATNKPWMLDEAMLRPGRLDARIYVPLPDAPARYRMLEMYLGSRPLAEDVDLGDLCDVLDGYTGADIRNIAERAASRPFMESVAGRQARPIAMTDVMAVIKATPPSVRKHDLILYERFTSVGV